MEKAITIWNTSKKDLKELIKRQEKLLKEGQERLEKLSQGKQPYKKS